MTGETDSLMSMNKVHEGSDSRETSCGICTAFSISTNPYSREEKTGEERVVSLNLCLCRERVQSVAGTRIVPFPFSFSYNRRKGGNEVDDDDELTVRAEIEAQVRAASLSSPVSYFLFFLTSQSETQERKGKGQ